MTGGLLDWRQRWRRERSKICSFFLFALLAVSCFPRTADAVVNAEGIALYAFRDAITADPTGVFVNWNLNDATPCSWTGVTCDSSSRVTRLLLNGVGLVGTISTTLSQLSRLRTLSLSQNFLTGSIPSELSAISALYKVNLSLNALSGSVPAALGSLRSLRMLDLSGNNLTGSVSSRLFASCGRLSFIDLSFNKLSGTIPSSIGNCLAVTGIDFSYNNFQGSIPVELGNLQHLTWLTLEHNFLSGEIPSALGNCTALSLLDLGTNSLSGPLPNELAALKNLSFLGVYENFLTGIVTANLLYMPRIGSLNFSGNSFSGEIPPPATGACSQLQIFDLSGNNFSGSIPPSISGCSQLISLKLSSNLLSSTIPPSLTLLTNLSSLDLSQNSLIGTVPAEIGNLNKLTVLQLDSNPITGTIPTELGGLSQLQILQFQNMKLDGSVPSTLASLKQLSTLDLSSNNLSGDIPQALTSLSNLTFLRLSSNILNGSIPTGLANLTKLQDLDLSNNTLSGSIPSSLETLLNLTSFNVSYNNLSGLIPSTGAFRRFNESSFVGNPGLCGSPLNVICASTSPLPAPEASRGSGKTHVLSASSIVAISAAAFIAIAILLVTLVNLKSMRKRRNSDVLVYESSQPSPEISPIVGKLVLFSKSLPSSYEDWEAGTKALLDKDCMIGKGSLGTVYKATFEGGVSIAVKKLDTLGRIKNQEDFEHEMGLLGNLRPHPNLVPLQGYYWSAAMQLLLTDFVPNESLYYHLHHQSSSHTPLSWSRRFKIGLGTARGLAYLHHDCKPPIFHFDLKVSNILLDENFEPRVTDYGLGKLLPMLDTYISSRKFHTTLGYVAPELACQSLRLNEKCDVYSFGMVLLELVTGRQPVESFENSVIVLGEFVRTALEQGGRMSTCVDPRLDAAAESEIMQVLKLGLICTSQNPNKRPTMAEVVQVLESIKSSSNSSQTTSRDASAATSAPPSGNGSVAPSP